MPKFRSTSAGSFRLSFLLMVIWMASRAVAAAPNLEPLPNKAVVLTFDDSVKSHATVVAPLLKEFGFSATFFITEGFDFTTNKSDYMTWDEIRQLHDAGFEIGNHTVSHMGVSAATLARLPAELAGITAECERHGIPRPVSFAYPGNSIDPNALPILQEAGFKFARRGGSPEYTYEQGKGVAYEPGRDHPLLIPTAGDARPTWTLRDFTNALERATPGTVAVFQFHGVPDRQHPWVHTPPERFREYLAYLKSQRYQVMAMRDLARYVDLSKVPSDPMTPITERQRAIAARLSAGAESATPVSRTPWDLETLSKAPDWAPLQRPKAEGNVRAITFAGPSWQGKPTRVFAWLGIPKVAAGEKVPAMVLIHGGGGTAFDEWVKLWVDRGYAAIAMDTCGQIPVGNYGHWFRNDQGGPPGWGGLDQIERPREDQWTYHAVADAILAHSLIRALPEVDADRTGVTGISWGGYLTCIVAGVDARFKLAVPVYGCGFYRETIFDNELKKLIPAQADLWMSWWDPSVYLPNAEMPILWVTGSNDFAYTLPALQHSYRLPKGPRTLCIRLRMPHGHGGAGENPEEIRVFADSVLKGKGGLMKITGTHREGTTVSATYAGNGTMTKAELNFTKDEGRWQDRKWEALPMELGSGRVSGTLPDGARVYYVNLFDERGCVVSSEHETP